MLFALLLAGGNMKYVWYAAIAAGIIGLAYVLLNWGKMGNTTAPLNASGYTYPSTGGA